MYKTDKPITRIEDIQEDAGEKIVELSGWSADKPFVAKLCRVSLMEMASTGKIPNQLTGAVLELYKTGKLDKASTNLKYLAETMLLIAEQCLVEPSMQQLRDANVKLTDLQLTQIYSFGTQGVNALVPFREKQSVLPDGPDSQSVAAAAQRVAENL